MIYLFALEHTTIRGVKLAPGQVYGFADSQQVNTDLAIEQGQARAATQEEINAFIILANNLRNDQLYGRVDRALNLTSNYTIETSNDIALSCFNYEAPFQITFPANPGVLQKIVIYLGYQAEGYSVSFGLGSKTVNGRNPDGVTSYSLSGDVYPNFNPSLAQDGAARVSFTYLGSGVWNCVGNIGLTE